VLRDTTSYSTDIRPYMGKSGSATDGDIGGLGFTDPPDHTACAACSRPSSRCGASSGCGRHPGDRRPPGRRDRSCGRAQRHRRPVPTFAFPIPFLVICDLLGLPDESARRSARSRPPGFDVTGGGTAQWGAIGVA